MALLPLPTPMPRAACSVTREPVMAAVELRCWIVPPEVIVVVPLSFLMPPAISTRPEPCESMLTVPVRSPVNLILMP